MRALNMFIFVLLLPFITFADPAEVSENAKIILAIESGASLADVLEHDIEGDGWRNSIICVIKQTSRPVAYLIKRDGGGLFLSAELMSQIPKVCLKK